METFQSTENNKKSPIIFHGDPVIWIIFFILCAISIVEVYSATSTLSYKDGHYWMPVVKHSTFLFVGFIITFFVHNIHCRWFRLYPLLFIPLSWILLILTPFVGESVNGAYRGIPLLGVNIQASELAKGTVVIATALILSITQTPKGTDKHAFKFILILTVITCLLIAPENFSTAAILFIVVVFLMFIGHVPYIQLGKLLGILTILGTFAVTIIITLPDETLTKIPKGHRFTTWKHRIDKFSNHGDETEVTPATYNMADNAQVANAKIAIATSNIIGKLPGNSVQRDFLSQAYSDFIYAIILEELGLVGGIGVVLLYIILFFRAGKIARQCERNFPAFLVMGLSLLLVIQAMINMCVAVSLIPVTGQPLPLISRGGASTLINCVYIGMILSVSRFAKRRERSSATNPIVDKTEFQETEGIS